MKIMILQMTAAQLLMQMLLTLYNRLEHLTESAQSPHFLWAVTVILAGLPGILYCMLEPALRVQNHCRKRWRHVIACLFFWGLECAAFMWIVHTAETRGIFPPCSADDAGAYFIMPGIAFAAAVIWALICFPSEWYREKRTARLYGSDDSPQM